MRCVLFISLLAVTSVFANVFKDDSNSKICTQELEGIVYIPKTSTYAYLKSINKILKAQSLLFWNNPAQAKSVFDSFEATYGVVVRVADAFGTIYFYPGSAPVPNRPKVKTHSYFQAIALGEGYSANARPDAIDVISDIYASIYWSPDGQMYIVAIMVSIEKAQNFWK